MLLSGEQIRFSQGPILSIEFIKNILYYVYIFIIIFLYINISEIIHNIFTLNNKNYVKAILNEVNICELLINISNFLNKCESSIIPL